jgi:hypothetical protein
MGSMIAAASRGETASAMMGTPTSASPPPNPPFANPTRITAGTAAA